MWQRCISSVWNDSKLLLSLGTHRELEQATTTTWQFWNTSCAPRRPLDVARQIYGHVCEPQSGELSTQNGKSREPVYLACTWGLSKSSLKSIDMWPMYEGHSAKCSLWLDQKKMLWNFSTNLRPNSVIFSNICNVQTHALRKVNKSEDLVFV